MLAEIGDDIFKARLGRAGEGVAQIAFVVAGERVVKTAVALERGRRADETLCCQRRRPHAVTRGLGFGKIRIHHAGTLTLDQAARKTGRQRNRADRLRVVQPHQLRRRRRAAENSVGRAGAVTARLRRWNEIARHAALHFVARDDGSQQFLPVPAFAFCSADAGGNDQHAGVSEHVIRVALIVDRNRHAVRERSTHPSRAAAVAPYRRALAAAHFPLT